MKRNTSRSDGRHPIRAMFGGAALVLLAVSAFSYRQLEQFKRANAEAAQTRDVVDSLDQLLSSVTDAETGQRGFLLTGDGRYLQPYNQALQVIPNQLGTVRRLLGGRASESGNLARLNNMVDQKVAELRQTVDLRRAQGIAPAMTVVLSDQGQRAMDEIRALVAQIRRSELSSQARASTEGEATTQTALLAAVAGSLVLLFLFAFGLEPFASPDPQAQRRSWPLRYGVAVLTVVVIVLLRMALTPLMGSRSMPFTLFFPAVWFAAWFGGVRPGALSVVLSVLAGSYFFAEPTRSLLIRYHDDQVAMLMLVIVGLGMALLSRSQQLAVVRAMQAENAERVERQRFETTLASIGDAVIVTDARGHVTFSNKVALSLTGWRGDEASGKHLDEVFRIVNEYTRAVVESPVTRVIREGTVAGLANHTMLLARDGREVPIDDSAAPIRDGSGAVQGAVLVFRDITERRRAEATSHILASIVESSYDAIISKDLNGIVTSWNSCAEKTFGYTAAEMIGQSITRIIPPELHGDESRILATIARGERIEHFETVRLKKNGELIEISLTISPVKDESGRIVGAAKIARDITQRKKAERALRTSERLASVGRLAATVAHEINNPLEAVTNLIFLAKGTARDKETADYLATAEEELGRVSHLTRQTLGFYRESRTVSALPVRAIIESLIGIFSSRAGVRGIELCPQVRPGAEIRLVPGEIRQVLANLISNSIDALRAGGQVRIRASAATRWKGEPTRGVRLTVGDNGAGIPAELHSKLFEPFFTTKEDVGTGLGLWVCKTIVETHHGSIQVRSRTTPGKSWTVFSVFLPAPVQPSPAAPGMKL